MTRQMTRMKIAATLFAVLLPVTAQADGHEIGDAAAGEAVFKKECSKCHMVGDGAKNRVGPVLNEVFGRAAGHVDGFKYSKGMLRMGADGLTWTLETLHPYLENPRALVSGTKMSYKGLKDEEKRADLLAYLRTYSASPQNIPEAEPTAVAEGHPDISPEVLALVGDVAYGEYLSSECVACHQQDGSDQGIPSITSWPEEDFVVAMHAYKQELRPHPVMQMMAGRLNDEEIAALAAYFATLE